MTHTLKKRGGQVIVLWRMVIVFGQVEECGHEAGGRVGPVAHIC